MNSVFGVNSNLEIIFLLFSVFQFSAKLVVFKRTLGHISHICFFFFFPLGSVGNFLTYQKVRILSVNVTSGTKFCMLINEYYAWSSSRYMTNGLNRSFKDGGDF